jgi:hypothetical protein
VNHGVPVGACVWVLQQEIGQYTQVRRWSFSGLENSQLSATS